MHACSLQLQAVWFASRGGAYGRARFVHGIAFVCCPDIPRELMMVGSCVQFDLSVLVGQGTVEYDHIYRMLRLTVSDEID